MNSQEAVERLESVTANLMAAIAEVKAMHTQPAAAVPTGVVFPFGTSKGKPVAGADMRSLEFFRGACLKTLADPDKQRFHEKERGLLAAIEAEMRRQGVDPQPASSFEPPPPSDADAPPPEFSTNSDIPF